VPPNKKILFWLSNSLVVFILIGFFFSVVFRTTPGGIPYRDFYDAMSDLLNGVSLLMIGAFLLLPEKAQASLIENSWLRKIPLERLRSHKVQWLAIIVTTLGCIFMLFFITEVIIVFGLIGEPTIPSNLFRSLPTNSLGTVPTWTATP
jgi:hypothetical protein